jgi:hypothetical protein
MAERGGPVIRLQDGPGAGWQFYEDDFLERIRAAQRMGRTVPDASGWALGYERPVSGVIWIWRGQLPPRPARVAAPGRVTVQPGARSRPAG